MSAPFVSLTTVAGKLLALDEHGALWKLDLEVMNIVAESPRPGVWRRLVTSKEEIV